MVSLNFVLAASTTSGQALSASTISQTLRVLPVPSNGSIALPVFLVAAAAAPSSATARAVATAIPFFTRSSEIGKSVNC